MNSRKAKSNQPLDVTIAYAANRRGGGVAYAAISGEDQALRVPFTVDRRPALSGREVGYAALIAVAAAVRSKGLRCVRLCIGDERVVLDLAERRPLPLALALLYVQLKCRLNTFTRAEVVTGEASEDLASRARAEVELAAAA